MNKNQEYNQVHEFNFQLISELGRNLNNLKIFNSHSIAHIPESTLITFLLGNLPFTQIQTEEEYYYTIGEIYGFLNENDIPIDEEVLGCYILLRMQHEINFGKHIEDGSMQDIYNKSVFLIHDLFFHPNQASHRRYGKSRIEKSKYEIALVKEEIVACLKNIL